MTAVLFALAIATVCAVSYAIYYYHNAEYSNAGGVVAYKKDAKITHVNRKTVGSKTSKRYETQVIFSDGFRYVSHKTNVRQGFLMVEISYTAALQQEIIQDAIEAHQKAYEAALLPPKTWKDKFRENQLIYLFVGGSCLYMLIMFVVLYKTL